MEVVFLLADLLFRETLCPSESILNVLPGFAAYPFTPELVALSTKKRCAKM